ncbi:MAG: ATP-binding protein, partial [Chloroflexota bacterium]|nr:ATP-binding protein [Chloroflexota bacterium]
LSPGVPGQGMNPFVINQGDAEELLLRIGSLRRLIEVMVGERLSAERRAALDHALAGYYSEPRERTGFKDFYAYLQDGESEDLAKLLRPFATGSLRHILSDEGDDLLTNEALVTVFDLRLLEPELRPAAAMVCTETVWAAAAQNPRPRLLVVDEVWSIMQHPEGAAFMISMAKRARKHRLGLQFITQDVQDLLSEDTSRAITGHSGRALLQNAAFKLLLQQDAAAISTVGDAFDLPVDLQRWLLSCPRGDGLLLARGGRFPVRIEATPEEAEVIEWRPGRHQAEQR